MDKNEALGLIEEKLQEYRAYPYSKLEAMMGSPETGELEGPSDARYQFEIEAFWDSRAHANIRVIGSIDDMGWRAFSPLSSDFIMVPDGSFVGE